MDDDLKAAIAELRQHGAANHAPMDHLTDAEVLEGAMQAMKMMPGSTAAVVEKHVALVLGRFMAANGNEALASVGAPYRRGDLLSDAAAVALVIALFQLWESTI